MQEHNSISRMQYFALMVLISLSFKVVMLPSLVARDYGRHGLYIVLTLAVVEALFMWAFYTVSAHGGIEQTFGKVGKYFVLVPMLIFFLVKLTINSTEYATLTSSELFGKPEHNFVFLTVIPVAVYIGSRKAFEIGRIANLLLWVCVAAIAINLIFFSLPADINNLMPMIGVDYLHLSGGLLPFGWWLGDAMPLVFMKIHPQKEDVKQNKLIIYLIVFVLALMAFFIAFFALYGDAAKDVKYAIAKIALFNKLSDELGGFDWPIKTAWLTISTINLSVLIYGIIGCLKELLNIKIHPFILGIVLTGYLYFVNFGNSVIENIFINSPIKYGSIIILALTIAALLGSRSKQNESQKQ